MILETVATVALTLGGTLGCFRFHHLRGKLEESQGQCATLYTQAIFAEQGKARAEQELEFLKSSVVQMYQRPVVGAISDAQIQNIVQALIVYANAKGSPDKLN